MTDQPHVKTKPSVVVRFSGDSGDGMQLTGTIFSDLSAIFGNSISTFPDFPAEIRAPQGTLAGVSGFQVQIGTDRVFTPGDVPDVLVAMNPAALKANADTLGRDTIIIVDADFFEESNLKKVGLETDNPFLELQLETQEIIPVPISSMTKASLAEFGLDNKSAMRCKNMFALGLVCWLFNRPMDHAFDFLNRKFSKKEELRLANVKVLTDGYNYGENTHMTASTYRIEGRAQAPGRYLDLKGSTAIAYGLMAASERSGLPLFLGSYPITPATDILHELAKFKMLGVKTMQGEDEISGITTAIGASFAGSLAVTTTSGPGVALKSEAMGLAVIAELPLVIVDVQRGGPSTGLPTKSEQTDLLQVLYGRNGESPLPVIAATTPSDSFEAAYWASKLAVEHMTPVVLLSDSFLANGSTAWRVPEFSELPGIRPNYVKYYEGEKPWKPYRRDEKTHVRFWAIPGDEGFQHRLGGLEKDFDTSAISTSPINHQRMTMVRKEKIDYISEVIPEQELLGDEDADLLIIGWGGTFGHLYAAMEELREQGHKVALTHFRFINPLPKNTVALLSRFSNAVVVEQNMGQFALYLRSKVPGFEPRQFNRVKGQPFKTGRLVEELGKMLEK